MKRVSQLTALALLMGLAASTTCAAETMPALTLFHLQQQHGVAIDTRLSAYYNGWPQRANVPEGHEPQALNLSARWLGAMSDDQLRAWAKQHQLQSDTPIALYGSPEDNASVAARLKQTGFTRLSTLSDALSQTDRLQKLPHFEQLVYPQWLHDLRQSAHRASRTEMQSDPERCIQQGNEQILHAVCLPSYCLYHTMISPFVQPNCLDRQASACYNE